MTIDSRKKKLKFLRRTRYDSFVKVCQELGITYTFPPEYYRRVTRRWLAKKAFCNKVTFSAPNKMSQCSLQSSEFVFDLLFSSTQVFKEVQKQKAAQSEKLRAAEVKEMEPTSSTEPQGTAVQRPSASQELCADKFRRTI